jgi:hypothetical protein
MEVHLVIVVVGPLREPIQFGFRDVCSRYQSLIKNQADSDAYRESAAAKSEPIYFIAWGPEVAACKLVERDNVPAKADAERSAQNGERFERRASNPIVIAGYLIVACQIQRAEQAPDVSPPYFGGRISRTIREQHDASWHVVAL